MIKKDMYVTDLAEQVEILKERTKEMARDNENLQVTKIRPLRSELTVSLQRELTKQPIRCWTDLKTNNLVSGFK